jgi:hypothetical protein
MIRLEGSSWSVEVGLEVAVEEVVVVVVVVRISLCPNPEPRCGGSKRFRLDLGSVAENDGGGRVEAIRTIGCAELMSS